jgi:hypothetical protein
MVMVTDVNKDRRAEAIRDHVDELLQNGARSGQVVAERAWVDRCR